jgi:hypothetical protein
VTGRSTSRLPTSSSFRNFGVVLSAGVDGVVDVLATGPPGESDGSIRARLSIIQTVRFRDCMPSQRYIFATDLAWQGYTLAGESPLRGTVSRKGHRDDNVAWAADGRHPAHEPLVA